MRFLRLFLTIAFSLLVLLGGGYLIIREGMLLYASESVITDADFITHTNQWQTYAQQCQVNGTRIAVRQLQLRFTDATHYNLELSCDNFQQIVFQQRTLPWMVTKGRGSAGFVYNIADESLSGEITLQFWGQKREVFIDDNHPSTKWGESTLISDSLVSSCQAHGLRCCDPVTEIGSGDQFRNGVNNCQDSCYTRCIQRPQLLLFQTDPLIDPVMRETRVDISVPTVFFQYSFKPGAASIKNITIDYGDGSTDISTDPTNEFVKEFKCDKASCTFHVTIQAIDQDGIQSAMTQISTVNVILSNE